MEKAVKVEIQATRLNKLTTIIRSLITAGNAAASIGDIDTFQELENIRVIMERERMKVICK